jgi:hypothetical protein
MNYYEALTQGSAAPAEPPATDYYSGLTGAPRSDGVVWNRPTGELRAPRANDPVAASMRQPIAEGGAGAGTVAAASFATDREQARRIYASRLFPRMPIEEALARVSYGDDGRLFAVGEDGRPRYVEPVSPRRNMNPGNAMRWAASGAGDVPAIAGGVVGGAVASPTSIVLGPLAAAAGAAVGDAVRQNVAGAFDPMPDETSYNWGQTAREAALSGVGQAGGALFLRQVSPNTLRLPPRDVGRVARDPGVLAGARTAQATAASQGVDLSAGQASQLPSLLTLEDAALRNPNTMDPATEFFRRQGVQMRGAADRMLATISPVDDVTQAAQGFREGAEAAPRAVRREANRLARPSYQTAERAGAVFTPDLAAIEQLPLVQRAMNEARETYFETTGRTLPEVPDFQVWDLTRRRLRSMVDGAAADPDQRFRASQWGDVLDNLTRELDGAFPTYPAARATAAPGQRLATTLEDTATGRAASSGVDERARSVVAGVFERSNPQYVAQARSAVEQAGRLDEWNAGIRAYLQDAIQRASMSQEGLNPAMLRRQIWANTEDGVRRNMSAAMTPAQFRGFEAFMETVEAVARTFPMNSLTVQRQGGQETLRQAGEDGFNRFLRGAGNIASPEVLSTVRRGLNGVADWRNARNVNAVVDNLFSPDGLRFLEEMARLRPGAQRATIAVGQFLAQTGGAPAEEAPPPQ